MKALLLLQLISLGVCAADFPTPYNSEGSTEAPMPAEQAARGMVRPALQRLLGGMAIMTKLES